MKTNFDLMPYLEARFYAKKFECPMEADFDKTKSFRFEVIKGIDVYYFYRFKDGDIEPVDKDEIEEIFPDGLINVLFKPASQFAKVISRRPQ